MVRVDDKFSSPLIVRRQFLDSIPQLRTFHITTWKPCMTAAIVLVGGHSRRMGRPKAQVRLGDRTLLEHVLHALVDAVDRTIVVGRKDQSVVDLVPEAFRSKVRSANDHTPDAGPMEGVRSGLACLEDPSDSAFVCGCDTPLITPAFVRLLFGLAKGFDAAAPHIGGRVLPMPAVYRGSALPILQAAIDRGEHSLWRMHRQLNSRLITEAEIGVVDPELHCLLNVNDDAALETASWILNRRQSG